MVLFFVLTAFPLPFVYRWIRRRKEKRQATVLSEPAPTEPTVESVVGEPVKKEVPLNPAASLPPPPVFEVEKTEEASTTGKMLFYDPKQDLSHYKKPPLDLLEDYRTRITEVPQEELERNNQKIVECLRTFDIQIEKIDRKSVV